MATLNLDKRRAERDEKPHVVELDGEEWELPARLPMAVIQRLSVSDIEGTIALTFGVIPGQEARAKKKGDQGQLAADRVVAKIVARLVPLIDKDVMETILDELYELGDDEPKKKRRREPQDHLPPAS